MKKEVLSLIWQLAKFIGYAVGIAALITLIIKGGI